MAGPVLVSVVAHDGAVGRESLASIARLGDGEHAADVVVFDDRRPDLRPLADLRGRCRELGVDYYASPRALGVARTVNLALRRATSEGYDDVLVVDADLVVPRSLLDDALAVAASTPDAGALTPWSDAGGPYPIAAGGADNALAHQDTLDWASGVLHQEFGTAIVEVPSCSPSCVLLPVDVVRAVGLFDPLYGRRGGAAEDWSQRCASAGHRTLLSPALLVHRLGDRRAEPIARDNPILDLRHPSYRVEAQRFGESHVLDDLQERASRAIVMAAARRDGYMLEATWLPHAAPAGDVRVAVRPDGPDVVLSAAFGAFRTRITVPGGDVVRTVLSAMGAAPRQVTILDRGRHSDALAGATWEGATPTIEHVAYPERV